MRGVLSLAWGPTMIVALKLMSSTEPVSSPGKDDVLTVASGPQSQNPEGTVMLAGLLQKMTSTSEPVHIVEMLAIVLVGILAVSVFVAAVLWSNGSSVDSYKPFTDIETEAQVGSEANPGVIRQGEQTPIRVPVRQGEHENLSEELAERALCAQEIAKTSITTEMWEAMKGLSSSYYSPISSSSSEGSLFEEISRTSLEKLPFCLLMGDDPRPRPRSPSPLAAPGPSNEGSEGFLSVTNHVSEDVPTQLVSKNLRHPTEKKEKRSKSPKSKSRASE